MKVKHVSLSDGMQKGFPVGVSDLGLGVFCFSIAVFRNKGES